MTPSPTINRAMVPAPHSGNRFKSQQLSEHEPRWALIQRIKRDIAAGLYDDEQVIQAKLDHCVEAIISDIP
ncbi:MAG: hypothetical protein AAGC44_07320 [Planctomycetota bacterium]